MVTLDAKSSSLIIAGDLSPITRNPTLRFVITDSLKGRTGSDSIEIPFAEGSLASVYERVSQLLETHSVSFERGKNLSAAIKSHLEENERFTDFSRRAGTIRNNEVSESELRRFTEVLGREFPDRTLTALQLLSAYHLAFAQNACNFSVPGAGKTTMVYAAYAYLRSLDSEDPKHVDKILVVSPLGAFGPWEDEYRACFGTQPTSKRLSGGAPEAERRRHLLSKNPAELGLISYQALPYMESLISDFLQNNKVMLILDEAHKIKNVNEGVIASTALRLAPLAKSRVVLTGTPAPNTYQDLYNLFEFIWPKKRLIKYHPSHLLEMTRKPNDRRVPELVRDISPFFVRIRKSDLNLPPPTEHPPFLLDMDDRHRLIYDTLDVDYRSELRKAATDRNVLQQFLKARLIRLMQAASNPALLLRPLDEYFQADGISDSILTTDETLIAKVRQYSSECVPNKFKKTLELVMDLRRKGERVVVWSSFIETITALGDYLRREGIENKLLYGKTPVERDEDIREIETRESIVREFMSDTSTFSVLIANPFAASESISLHKKCHNAIYYDRTYNAIHFLQSKDRIHRVGLPEGVITNYYYLLSKGTIDEVIDRRLTDKEERMLQIIESEPIPLLNMNMDYETDNGSEIKALVRDYVEFRSPSVV